MLEAFRSKLNDIAEMSSKPKPTQDVGWEQQENYGIF
jgi:hypothetical protein